MDVLKVCVTCHEAQPRGEFNKRAAAVDGLQSPCRSCCRRRYERNRDAHVANVEFDHREGMTKLEDVTRLVNVLAAWETVEAEMAECDVCCANCHRRRTARRADRRRHRFQLAREAEEARVLEQLWSEVHEQAVIDCAP